MNFSNHTFLTNSVYGSTFTTLTLFISQSCKDKERCAKTRFEFVEMHTNQLDPHLIGIIKWWVFDLNSVNLEVYLNRPAIVCIRIYKQVIYNGGSNDIHVRWMILIKTIYYQERFKLRWISANQSCLILSVTTFNLMPSFIACKVNGN